MKSGSSVLGAAARDAAEIAAELRREFDIALQQRYGTQAQPDPVLATLFHAFATQIGRLYQEAEHVFPLGVLDDLLAGLGMPPRLAEPAQTVVAFTGITRRERLPLDTGLLGVSRSGSDSGSSPTSRSSWLPPNSGSRRSTKRAASRRWPALGRSRAGSSCSRPPRRSISRARPPPSTWRSTPTPVTWEGSGF